MLSAEDNELEELRRAAATHRDDMIIQLGGWVGLRAFETPQIRPTHIKRAGDGEHYRHRAPSVKDTAGNGGKPRDAYLPAGVEGDLQRYQNAENVVPDTPFVDLTERDVRAVVKRTAARAAERSGLDD